MFYSDDINYNYEMEMYRVQQKLADLLVEAMKDERHDRVKYNMMMEMTNDKKVRDQIDFAYKDEIKHYELFRKIYYALFRKNMEVPIPKTIEHYENLKDAVESSINGELEAVELYRKIQSMLPNMQMRDTLFEIITDEQEHATRFVYLYSMLKK